MDFQQLDRSIRSLEDAVRVARAIYEHAGVPEQEIQALLTDGTVGPAMRQAQQIADSLTVLPRYAEQSVARLNGRPFQSLVATGEAELVLLCMDVGIADTQMRLMLAGRQLPT